MNDVLTMDFNRTPLPAPSEVGTWTTIEDVDGPFNPMWIGPTLGFGVFANLKDAHGTLISAIVGVVAAIAGAAVALGIYWLVTVVRRNERVWICKTGVILIKARGFKSLDWFEIPWSDVVKLDLRKSVSLLYGGTALHQRNITFVQRPGKGHLVSLADTLLLHQHRGEIPQSIQILAP